MRRSVANLLLGYKEGKILLEQEKSTEIHSITISRMGSNVSKPLSQDEAKKELYKAIDKDDGNLEKVKSLIEEHPELLRWVEINTF